MLKLDVNSTIGKLHKKLHDDKMSSKIICLDAPDG